MKIYFVRHGETDWNVRKKIQGKTDIPLNTTGIFQAKKLADKLVAKKLKVARTYTSPQLRAAETAQIVADALQVECIPLADLVEMNLGEWEGLNWDIIEAEYGELYYNWNTHRRYVKTPGGECYNEVVERTLKALAYILEKEHEDVLVVTHSAVLMALRCYLRELPFEEMVSRFKTKNAEVVAIDAADVRSAIVRFRNGN